jgi:hypothetical protein
MSILGNTVVESSPANLYEAPVISTQSLSKPIISPLVELSAVIDIILSPSVKDTY